MAEENELVTVFRSADADAEEQASVVRDMLEQANIAAQTFDDSAPGVPEGVFEVRVPRPSQEQAERLISANTDPAALDPSHDLDMVTVFVSDAPDAELVSTQIRSILDAQGITSLLVSGSMFPNFPFEVRVPRERLEDARQAIAAAEDAGPAAAEEAEREYESGETDTAG
jgi:hypothetical protein